MSVYHHLQNNIFTAQLVTLLYYYCIITLCMFEDINAECRKKDLERLFQKYGPLKEIWLASYAPFYAFIVYRSKSDAEVWYGGRRVSYHGVLSACLL